MNILVTGCAGLLGSRFAEWVITHHPTATVVGIDDLSGGFLSNVPSTVLFHNMDCGSVELDMVFARHKFDIVYHFSAYAAEALSPFIRKFNYTNNLVATANIVNLCVKYAVGRLVFTSSMAVYGDQVAPFHEDLDRHPIDPYGVAKMAAEMDIQIAGTQHGLDWCIIRPHNVYGYNQNIWDAYRNFIGIAMYKSLVGDPITVYGDGLQTRAFSDMQDALAPLWEAGTSATASKQIINLGGIHETSILKVAHIVSELSGAPIIHLPARHEVRHAFATYNKSIDLLGFQHTIDVEVGIANMWEWAKTQPTRERFVWAAYELDKGVYPQWTANSLRDGFWKA